MSGDKQLSVGSDGRQDKRSWDILANRSSNSSVSKLPALGLTNPLVAKNEPVDCEQKQVPEEHESPD